MKTPQTERVRYPLCRRRAYFILPFFRSFPIKRLAGVGPSTSGMRAVLAGRHKLEAFALLAYGQLVHHALRGRHPASAARPADYGRYLRRVIRTSHLASGHIDGVLHSRGACTAVQRCATLRSFRRALVYVVLEIPLAIEKDRDFVRSQSRCLICPLINAFPILSLRPVNCMYSTSDVSTPSVFLAPNAL